MPNSMPSKTEHRVVCELTKPFDADACFISDIITPNATSTSYYTAREQGENKDYCVNNPAETGDLIIEYLVNDTPEVYETLKAATKLISDTILTPDDSKVSATYVRESPDGDRKVTRQGDLDQCVVKSVRFNTNHPQGVAITLTIHGIVQNKA